MSQKHRGSQAGTTFASGDSDLIRHLDRLRSRLARFAHDDEQHRFQGSNASSRLPNDTETLGGISQERIQSMAEDFSRGVGQLMDNCAVPNATLHLLKMRDRGLLEPPPPFGTEDQSTEDIWATFLCNIEPLCDVLSEHWTSSQPEASGFDRAHKAQSLVPMTDSCTSFLFLFFVLVFWLCFAAMAWMERTDFYLPVILDRNWYEPSTNRPLPKPLTTARQRRRPPLPSWVHPMDAIWVWNSHLGFAPQATLTSSELWLSDIQHRLRPD